jgi:hypothetical protein
MMERVYTKLVFETWYLEMDIESAIAAGEYTKTYYLDDRTIGRVDLYDRDEGLCKVSYREVPPPHDELVAEHRSKYPSAMCEVWTPAVRSADGLRVSRTCLYDATGMPDVRFEIHSDDNGRWQREIRLGPDGDPIEERRPLLDGKGEQIGFELYDPAGHLHTKYFNDDWT